MPPPSCAPGSSST